MNIEQLKAARDAGCRIQHNHGFAGEDWSTLTPNSDLRESYAHNYRVHPDDLHKVAQECAYDDGSGRIRDWSRPQVPGGGEVPRPAMVFHSLNHHCAFSPDFELLESTANFYSESQMRAALSATQAQSDMEGLDFDPDEQHAVADMANVGYSLMQTIARNCPDYAWNESPAEIVCDLINQRDEAQQARSDGGEVDRKTAAKVLTAFTRICINELHDDAYAGLRVEAMQRALAEALPQPSAHVVDEGMVEAIFTWKDMPFVLQKVITRRNIRGMLGVAKQHAKANEPEGG